VRSRLRDFAFVIGDEVVLGEIVFNTRGKEESRRSRVCQRASSAVSRAEATRRPLGGDAGPRERTSVYDPFLQLLLACRLHRPTMKRRRSDRCLRLATRALRARLVDHLTVEDDEIER